MRRTVSAFVIAMCLGTGAIALDAAQQQQGNGRS